MEENIQSKGAELTTSMAGAMFNMSIRVHELKDIYKSNQIKEQEDKVAELIRVLIKDYAEVTELYHDLWRLHHLG